MKRDKHTLYYVFAVVLVVLNFKLALAVIPPTLNYQGHLTDSAGVPVDGPVNMVFAIYDVDSGGAALWSEARSITVNQGVFFIELGGGGNPFPPGLFENPLWMGLSVGSDAEMVPRRAINSVAYSFKADDANTLEGVSASTLDQSVHVIDTSNPHNVTSAQVGALSGSELATHAADPDVHHAKTTSLDFLELTGEASDTQIPATIARDTEILPTLLANDGAGSNIDADLFDGLDSSAFMTSGADIWVNTTGDTMTGRLTLNVSDFEVLNINSSNSHSWLRWQESGFTRGLIGYSGVNTFWADEIPNAFMIRGDVALHLGDAFLTMTIDDSNVGIGTSVPQARLHVAGTAGDTMFTGNNIEMTRAGQNYIYALDPAGTLHLGAGGNSNDLVITTFGDVGIGTTITDAKLHVAGNIKTTDKILFSDTSGQDTAGAVQAYRPTAEALWGTSGYSADLFVACPAGTGIIGGGWRQLQSPRQASVDVWEDGPVNNGWRVGIRNNSSTILDILVTAICAPGTTWN